MESRKLEKEVTEKEDSVIDLDELVVECEFFEKKSEQCEKNKKL